MHYTHCWHFVDFLKDLDWHGSTPWLISHIHGGFIAENGIANRSSCA
ncbi:MAG: hypothetical protein AAF462_08540 [Thermodesulfobacteriota bacterium]